MVMGFTELGTLNATAIFLTILPDEPNSNELSKPTAIVRFNSREPRERIRHSQFWISVRPPEIVVQRVWIARSDCLPNHLFLSQCIGKYSFR